MKTFDFEVDFGGGPKFSNVAKFSLELDEEEIAYIKDYLHRNGDCGYEYIEFDSESIYPDFNHGALFEKINDAANDAVVAAINEGREEKLEFEDIPWENMFFDFIWDERLMDEEKQGR